MTGRKRESELAPPGLRAPFGRGSGLMVRLVEGTARAVKGVRRGMARARFVFGGLSDGHAWLDLPDEWVGPDGFAVLGPVRSADGNVTFAVLPSTASDAAASKVPTSDETERWSGGGAERSWKIYAAVPNEPGKVPAGASVDVGDLAAQASRVAQANRAAPEVSPGKLLGSVEFTLKGKSWAAVDAAVKRLGGGVQLVSTSHSRCPVVSLLHGPSIGFCDDEAEVRGFALIREPALEPASMPVVDQRVVKAPDGTEIVVKRRPFGGGKNPSQWEASFMSKSVVCAYGYDPTDQDVLVGYGRWLERTSRGS